jgi:uncharacterized protein (DUF1697 family)
MKYLALLRGINVGGNATVNMATLKQVFENAGYTNVMTYINSGNVVFDSDESNNEQLTKKIETILQRTFFPIKIVVLSHRELLAVIDHMPKNWKATDLRKYIAFIKNPTTPEDLIKEAQLKDGIDFIAKGPGVVYLSTKMEGLTKSNFPKLIAKKVYKEATMRNYNTIQKLLSMMEKKQNNHK